MAKPNILVEVTMRIVCALRGFKTLTWATARDFLGKPSLIIELKQASVSKGGHLGSLKAEYVLRAQ